MVCVLFGCNWQLKLMKGSGRGGSSQSHNLCMTLITDNVINTCQGEVIPHSFGVSPRRWVSSA
jgi:hypothetical protein